MRNSKLTAGLPLMEILVVSSGLEAACQDGNQKKSVKISRHLLMLKS